MQRSRSAGQDAGRAGFRRRFPRLSRRPPRESDVPGLPARAFSMKECTMKQSWRRLMATALLAITALAGAQSVAPPPPPGGAATPPVPGAEGMPGELMADDAALVPPRREDPTWSAT